MINDQITDSVTQIMTYKEGMGDNRPRSITIKLAGNMYYDEAIAKYLNPADVHLPSIEECDVVHRYMGNKFASNGYMTVELRDDSTITIADLNRGLYMGAKRSDTHPVVLVDIKYN